MVLDYERVVQRNFDIFGVIIERRNFILKYRKYSFIFRDHLMIIVSLTKKLTKTTAKWEKLNQDLEVFADTINDGGKDKSQNEKFLGAYYEYLSQKISY